MDSSELSTLIGRLEREADAHPQLYLGKVAIAAALGYLAPGLVVAYERNIVTNAALESAGIEVIPIAGSELGSGRGGPRCMSCPVLRDPL